MSLHDNTKVKGGVELCVSDAGGLIIQKAAVPNTVLRCGKRRIAAALGGGLLSSGAFEAFVTHVAWGTGGTDGGGNRIVVPDTATGFVGGSANVLATTVCEASMVPNDDPAIIFHAAVGRESPLNGQWINQAGLVMSDGTYLAITTWAGFLKDSNHSFILNWTEWFL